MGELAGIEWAKSTRVSQTGGLSKIAWGKITSYEIHEDTEKVVALDEYVASLESPAV